MPLLRVHRKAANESDARTLLKASMRIQNPLGTNTVFLDESTFKDVDLDSPVYELSVAEKLIPYIGTWDKALDTDLTNPDHFEWITAPLIECVWQCYSHHHSSSAVNQQLLLYWIDEKDPKHIMNVVFAARANTNTQTLLPAIDSGAMPDFSNALQFFMLWHEIAHSLKATEPQADLIATCIARQNFADDTHIKFYSDVRAFISFGGTFDSFTHDHADWAIVNALDYALSLPQDVIDNLNEDDLKALSHIKFDTANAYAMTPLISVFKSYAWPENYISELNHGRMIDVCDAKLNGGQYEEGSKQRRVLERFKLAAQRLNIGLEAYKPDSPLKPDNVFDAVPDNLPAFLDALS